MGYYDFDGYSFNPITEDMLKRITEHRNSRDTWRNLTDSRPVFSQEGWLRNMGSSYMYFEVSNDSSPIGIVRITDIDYINSNACVGLDIYKAKRGSGHGIVVFKMLAKYCFEVMNLNRLWLLVRHDNIPAIKIYLRNGFREEGVLRSHLYKDGEYHDYILMGILRKEWENDTTVQSSFRP